MMNFHGVFPAVITPFKNGSVDEDSFRKIVKHCLKNGVHGVVPCGTTGESPVLTDDEKSRLIKICVEECKGKHPVIAGAGSNNTVLAIKYGNMAKELGANAHLQVVPYYNKPTQDGLLAHFTKIADEVDLPMILYNVPGRTVAKLEVKTVSKLSEHKRIIGIKEATGDINIVKQLRENTPKDFIILSGDDSINFAIYKAGGNGTISVVANIWPKETVNVWNYFIEGKIEESLNAHKKTIPLVEDLFFTTSPMPAKGALHLMGFCNNELRLPLVPLNVTELERMKKRLIECGLIS